MLPLTMTSCTPHIIYKTKTEYVYPPDGLLKECQAVEVQGGATTKDDLLKLLAISYVETLKNINQCNIRIKEFNNYVEKLKEANK